MVFKKAKLSDDEAGGATIGMSCVNVIMTIISTMLVDRLGRRCLMLSGMAGMWVTSILIVICMYLVEQDAEKYKIAGYCVIVFVYLFVVSFATGPGKSLLTCSCRRISHNCFYFQDRFRGST